MKILLAVDGSAYTKKMLAYLVSHDTTFGDSHNEFTLLNSQPTLPPRARAVVGKEVVDDYYREEAERVLGPASKFLLRHGIDPKTAWKVGPAGESIAKFAEAGKFDLLVMGSHGHGALATLVLGSVSTQVLAHCRVPLLLVR